MIIRVIKSIVLSVIATVLVVFGLLESDAIKLIWNPLKRIRGTNEFEGESLGHENLAITEGIIMPAVFVICFTITMIIMQKRYKRKIQNNKAS
jgi:hypothetical protein